MARAALAVVYAHDRDDEVSALRRRVIELARPLEDLLWVDRLEQAIAECEDSNNYSFILNKVHELLVYPIEKQRWGLREGVLDEGDIPHAHGLLIFNRDDHELLIERTLLEHLVDAVENGERLALSAFLRQVEAELTLPQGSLVRLPASAPYRE